MSYTVERQRFQVSQKRIFQKMFKKPPQAHQILTEKISILCEISAPPIYGNPHTSEPPQALQILTEKMTILCEISATL